jgi:1,2-diacylglycerol 3-beta-galactosyltransferase
VVFVELFEQRHVVICACKLEGSAGADDAGTYHRDLHGARRLSAGQAKALAARHANRVLVQSDEAVEGPAARILFLYSETGGGHRAAAQAIDGALRELDGTQRIETLHVDAFASFGVFPLREGVASYGTMLKVQPSPYPAIYHLTNGRTRFRVISELGMPFMRRNLRRMLATAQPDIVVSVHPLLNAFARRLIESMHLPVALVTVITDLATIHHSWTSDAAADEYVVPSPEAAARCIERGIAPDRVHDLGLPIRDGFSPGARDNGESRAQLGLDPDRRMLLVMAGGEGGGRVKKLMGDIGPRLRALDLQVVVVAGKNESLRKRLAESADEFGRDARVLGFIDNVADYMRAADLLLTKAGPGAIAEAAACGLPTILYEYISGQEKGNLEYVTTRRTGVVALDSDAVIETLERLFAPDSTELAGMRVQALKTARPHAARDIALFLMDLAVRRETRSPIAPRATP